MNDKERSAGKKKSRTGSEGSDSSFDRSSSATSSEASSNGNRGSKTRWWVVLLGLMVAFVAIGLAGRWSLTFYGKAMARHHMDHFRYDAALEWLDTVEGFGSADAETLFLKARIYRKTGKFDEFEKTIAEARTKGLPQDKMENEKLLLQGQSGNIGLLQQNLERLAGGVEQFDPAEIYEALVSGCLLVGRFNEAGEYIDRWGKDFPDDPSQKFFKAVYLINYGPVAKIDNAAGMALELLEDITSEYPDHFQAAMTAGDLYLSGRQIDKALAKYRSVENNVHVLTEAQIKIAECLSRLGRQPEAKDYYDQVLQREPDNVVAQAELGKIQFNDGEYEQALKNLESAYSKRRWDFDLANSLARTLQVFDRQSEADALFQKSQEIRSQLSRIQDLKAEVDAGGGVDKRVELGKLLLEYGDPKLALIYIRSALDLDRRHPEANQVLSDYLRSQELKNPGISRSGLPQ